MNSWISSNKFILDTKVSVNKQRKQTNNNSDPFSQPGSFYVKMFLLFIDVLNSL